MQGPRAAAAARAASRSLRFRLALGFGLLAVLMTAGLTLVIESLATGLARKEIGRYLTRLSIEFRDKLDTGMAERMSEIEMLARLDSVFEPARNPGLRKTLIEELKRATPDYAWLGYTDADGRVQEALQGLLQGVDASARPWFTHGLAGPFAGDVRDAKLLANLLPRSGNELPRLVDIAFPLRRGDRTVGVVAAQINWSWAARLRDSIEGYARSGAAFELLVVSNSGVVLVGPRPLMGTRLELKELDKARLKALDARVERWPDGIEYLTGTSATRGFGQYRGLGWVVIARQRTEHAFETVQLLRHRIELAGGLFAIIAILLGWWIASRVGGPLTEISKAADAISRGSRRVQIPAGTGYAEVEQLSGSLRKMLRSLSANEEELRQSQEQLENRVRARTAELAKARAEIELEAAALAVARDESNAAKDQLAQALEASRLVSWNYDVDSGTVQLSEGWSELLGGARKPTTDTIESLAGLVPEEDRPAVQAQIAAAIKGPESWYRIEHRVRTASGEPIWIVSEGRVVERAPDGRARRMVGTNRDVTEQTRATIAMRESEERFRKLTELTADWYWEVDEQSRFVQLSEAGLAAYRLPLGSVLGRRRNELGTFKLELIGTDEAAFAKLRAERKGYRNQRARFSYPDGTSLYVEMSAEPYFDAAGAFRGYRGVSRNITAQVAAENALRASEERFRGAMEYSPIGMALGTLDAKIIMTNPALSRIVGYSETELRERTFDQFTHPDDRDLVPTRLKELLAGKTNAYQVEKRYLHKDGHVVWALVNVSAMRDAHGDPQCLIAQILDVSERHRLQEEVRFLALHDTLTGLPNARLLQDRLGQAITAGRRAGQPVGVMYVDLDGFKPVNDTHGHAAGDLVLKEFAARLKRVLREADTVARVGGDEFVAVLAQINGENEARRAAERVLATAATPFDLGGVQVSVSASIGLALCPAHGEDAQTLTAHADAAMYSAKRAGKNAYRIFAGEEI